MEIDAQRLHYRDLNREIRQAIADGDSDIVLRNVNGHRYIGAGLTGDAVRLQVNGVPGNDLASFMDGPSIEVCGNAQDGVANTMNGGLVVVRGNAGDVLGYGMRGGVVYVEGDVGYRVGIHMKAYRDQSPTIVAGGTAGDFFGEYLAGGRLILLGLERNGKPLAGDYCGSGIHGGEIFLRGEYDSWHIATEHAAVSEAGEKDHASVGKHLEAFSSMFGVSVEEILAEPFSVLRPKSHRPFGDLYVNRP